MRENKRLRQKGVISYLYNGMNIKVAIERMDVMKRRLMAAGIICFCLLSLLLGVDIQNIYAGKVGQFDGKVGILKEEETNYVLQVTVSNSGEDFEGTVRLVLQTENDGLCAFDMLMTLPAQGEKQYTLSVPMDNINQSRGSGSLIFLDQNSKTLQTITFKNLVSNTVNSVSVGVLSDSYDKLTYMDMGGNTFYLQNTDKPINLVQIDPKDIQSSLDGLYFLIIDQFDMSTLDQETIEAVENWVSSGGWLILGTGEMVDKTLGAFDADFIDMSYGSVSKRGQENEASVSVNMGAYYMFEEAGIDFSNMAIADLMGGTYNAYPTSNFPGWECSNGDGSVTILNFSLCEEEMQNANSDIVGSIYEETMYNAASYNTYMGQDNGYLGTNAFGVIDHENTTVDFTWLKILILIYVVMVGPVLYLILRGTKKREWYWIGVPVLGILFIGAVFFFGKNLRVNTTKVYSVSIQQADGKEKGRVDTYYCAYHSGVKPWNITLMDNYEYGGIGFTNYSYSSTTAEGYHYRVGYGENIELGLSPYTNFENGYLYAGGSAPGCGEITTKDLKLTDAEQSGSVTNQTQYDFPYILLMSDNYIMVIPDVKAGETVDLEQASKDKRIYYEMATEYVDDLYYGLLGYYSGNTLESEENDILAALMISATQGRQMMGSGSNKIFVSGAVPDYTKTVKSKCSETSYGCLYTIAEQEVSNATN